MLQNNIIVIKDNQFQLNTKNTSYVMHNENGVLAHTYYGKRLPDANHGYMAKRCRYNGDFQSNVSENLPTLDNALLELEVIDKKKDFVVLKALDNGKIENHKTINVPEVNLKLDFMSDVDRKDIIFAAQHACDYLALSFVNTKEDVIVARKIIEDAGGDALIISKIESRMGIKNIDEIIEESIGENAKEKQQKLDSKLVVKKSSKQAKIY